MGTPSCTKPLFSFSFICFLTFCFFICLSALLSDFLFYLFVWQLGPTYEADPANSFSIILLGDSHIYLKDLVHSDLQQEFRTISTQKTFISSLIFVGKMRFPVVETVMGLVALTVFAISYWKCKWRDRSNFGKLPPGSMGLPFLGETIQFFIPSKSIDISPFLKKRIKKYRPIIFKDFFIL